MGEDVERSSGFGWFEENDENSASGLLDEILT